MISKYIEKKNWFIFWLFGLSLIILTGCASLTYISQAPEIGSNAYDISEGNLVVDLDQVSSLGEVGGSASIVNDSLPNYIIIARTGTTDYIVASSQCTHRQKALSYDHGAAVFKCSSMGGSEFNLDGSVTNGPTEEPLRIYRSQLDSNQLIIEIY